MVDTLSKKNEACRVCGSRELTMFLSLGETPLANSYLTEEQLRQDEPRVPLEVYFCGGCGLVQLVDIVPADVLFRNYLYIPSTSDTLRTHFAELASDLAGVAKLGSEDLVVEIASNDGLLLKEFRRLGIRTLGVEPALNIAEVSRQDGLEVVTEFFDSRTAEAVGRSHGKASAIVGTNVLAHVNEVKDFLNGVEGLLTEDGVACFEFPHLLELLEHCEFDTIYHEHLSYFSLQAISRLFRSVGLTVFDVRRKPIHGGSLRVFARKSGPGVEEGPAVQELLQLERDKGLMELPTYIEFAERVSELKVKLRELLSGLKAENKRIAAYGAAAKGMTMLSYCEIGSETLEYVIDRSPYKYGRWTPGSHLPILPPEKLAQDPPDYLLLLAWNFSEEIIQQQRAFGQAGGRFIVPVPEPRVV